MSDKNFKVKNGIDVNGTSTITSSSVSDTTFLVKASSGQYSSIQEWKVSDGTTAITIDANGHLFLNQRGVFVNSGWIGSTRFAIIPINSSAVGMIIKGQPSQTGNFTEWQNNSGTVLAKVDASGSITAVDLTLSGNLTVNGTTTNLNSTNLVIEDKNIIIADVATPTDTTADGAGITIKGATDKTFNWVQSTSSFTSSEPLIVNNTSTTTVPLLVKGYASQTANYFDVQNSAGTSFFKVVPPAGTALSSSAISIRPAGDGGRLSLHGDPSYGGFALTAPAGQSVYLGTLGGGSSLEVVASDSYNRYKIIGTGTGVAPTFTTDGMDTDVNMYITAKGAGKIGINKTSPTGYVHAVSSSSSTVGLIIEAASGQTSTNIFEVQRAGGGDASFSVSHNYIDLNRNTTAAASMTVYGPNAGAVPLYVKGRASQTADLQQWQKSDGTVLAKLYFVNSESSARISLVGADWNIGSGESTYGRAGADNYITYPVNQIIQSVYGGAVQIRGALSQTADLQQWQNSSGNILLSVSSDGVLNKTGTTKIGPILQFANPGIGNETKFEFLKTNDSAYLTVKEIGVDKTFYEFGMWDNAIDYGHEYFQWSMGQWSGPKGYGWMPIQLGTNSGKAQTLRFTGEQSVFWSPILTGTNTPYYTTSIDHDSSSSYDVTKYYADTNIARNVPRTNASGGATLNIDLSGYTYSSRIGYRITVNSGGTTFNYSTYGGDNSSGTNVSITGSWQTLSNGTKIKINGTAASGDDWQFLAFPTPLVSFGGAADTTSLVTIKPSSSNKGLIIKGEASQTANLQEWQNSSGTVLARVSSGGAIVTSAVGVFGAQSNTPNAQLYVLANNAALPTFVVRSISSQTGNLTEWQNSSGTVLAKVDVYGNYISGGLIITPSLATFANATAQIKGTSSSNPVLALQANSGSSTGDAITYYNAAGSAVLAKLDYAGNFSAVSKSFDIPHPTKENMRLRYASLEGPENSVYIRGTVESNIIELPEYWTGLVHEDSITASLTAVGSAQNIYVEKIEDNKVYIGGELTKAFFTVYGERKDIDKLTVEYKDPSLLERPRS